MNEIRHVKFKCVFIELFDIQSVTHMKMLLIFCSLHVYLVEPQLSEHVLNKIGRA